jgi:hypothetical protein
VYFYESMKKQRGIRHLKTQRGMRHLKTVTKCYWDEMGGEYEGLRRSAGRFMVGKPEGKQDLGKTRDRCENNIKVGLR